MIHEELKQLESIYLLLNDAFYNEDENKMKILFNEFIIHLFFGLVKGFCKIFFQKRNFFITF